MTLAGLLGRAVLRRPEADAVIDGPRRLDYAGLERCTAALKTGFGRLGIGHGDRVLIALRNRLEHVLAYWAQEDAGFQEELSRLRDDRFWRGQQMVERLNELGYPISFERVQEIAEGKIEFAVDGKHVWRVADRVSVGKFEGVLKRAPERLDRDPLQIPRTWQIHGTEVVCELIPGPGGRIRDGAI